MRTLIDIPEKELAELKRISVAEKRSRASIVRDAIKAYLDAHQKKKTNIEAAFGLWGDRKIDGVDYQRKLRSEW